MADSSDPQPPAEALDWEPLLAWLPRLDEEFDAGHWVAPRTQPDGVMHMPYAELSDAAVQFVRELAGAGVIAPFDWPAWMREVGNDLWLDAERMAEASLEDCRRLLAAMVRSDRFNEGSLLNAFESGAVSRTLHRIAELTRRRQA